MKANLDIGKRRSTGGGNGIRDSGQKCTLALLMVADSRQPGMKGRKPNFGKAQDAMLESARPDLLKAICRWIAPLSPRFLGLWKM